MESKYNHKECELNSDLLKVQLEKNKLSRKAKDNFFSVLMPPPNVTGKLHIGHAWNGTIQDCLIRYMNLSGKNSLWLAGMDHAGIATQTKYESFLRSEGKKLPNSRTERIADLKEWVKSNADWIRLQWKKMGFALDYEKEMFTLDDLSNKNVEKVFVDLYKKNLIYKDKKLVNWDTFLKTAISNIEVIKKESKTHMYYIKYWLENKTDFLTVATTRPETIFVDECLVVNPKDKRYQKLIGQNVINPLTNKIIKIISDNYVDIDFGTGIMKCTPAHDFNDYELGKKYKLKIVSCFNKDGTMNNHAMNFEGLSISECRKKVAKYFEENNLLVKKEEIVSFIGCSERSDTVVEPMLSEQWFIKMDYFSKLVLENQKSKNKVVFYPKRFENMLIKWLENVNDWCISRQLWWGHQIPAWKNKTTGKYYVDTKPPKDISNYERDTDVLDTWFSSGLWPITTTNSFNVKSNLFPTNVLVTAFDIIFFWVSRMIFFSLYFKKEIPFKHVYMTGLIRDEQGRKMSKSLGNGVDPNDIAEIYGADSLRLFLLSSSAPGEDLSFSEVKVKSAWNFINKLWNAFRFIYSNDFPKKPINKPDKNDLLNFDKWIICKFNKMKKEFDKLFKDYLFLLSIKKLTDFIWNDFCNVYLELNKKRIKENDLIFKWVLDDILKKILIMLHPICPFVTDYLYNLLPYKDKKSIIYESNKFTILNIKENLISHVIDIIEFVRNQKAINNFSKKEVCELSIYSDFFKKNSKKNLDEITNVFASENITLKIYDSSNNIKADLTNSLYSLIISFQEKNISKNINQEIMNIKNEIDKTDFEIKRCEFMLNNKNFMSKAPKEKIQLEKEKREQHIQKKEKLLKVLETFSQDIK